MPELTIDGRAVQVPDGTNLILAARKLGIDVPHFCYHPGLTVVGSCRMCQVEIEMGGRKRMDLACANQAADGMVVRVNTPETIKARKGVLEFLLMNHPIDCPVCDDAGECKLQDYYMVHGLYQNRLDVPKWHKPKVYSVGPRVILDAERCVLCSRCVRFCDEIWGDRQLGIFGHGSEEVLINYPGKELDNPYSVNVVDLCPVGALLEKKFRFQRRVWYLKSVKSICPRCSRGCNIYLHVDQDHDYKQPGKRVFRVKPRYNPEVNRWWISDRGRNGFDFIDQNRVGVPRIQDEEVTWEEALGRAAELIRAGLKTWGPQGLGVLVAPSASNEDAFVARRLLRDLLKLEHVDFDVPSSDQPQADHLLLTDDPYPNRQGFRDLGFGPGEGGMRTADIVKAAQNGKIKGLIVAGTDLEGVLGDRAAGLAEKLGWLICVSYAGDALWQRAAVGLPMAVYAERPGTFTNFKGKVQKFEQALTPFGASQPQWLIWQRLAQKLGAKWSYEDERAVFKDLSQGKPAYDTLDWFATFGAGPGPYNDNWYMW
ncbi:MAG: ferredoxin [Candidatus Zixiibacteriota bacterium]|nr:MAG: ferredoxin [candidate division Zixibacteria bacterium]